LFTPIWSIPTAVKVIFYFLYSFYKIVICFSITPFTLLMNFKVINQLAGVFILR
jgi:hypothetical protein